MVLRAELLDERDIHKFRDNIYIVVSQSYHPINFNKLDIIVFDAEQAKYRRFFIPLNYLVNI